MTTYGSDLEKRSRSLRPRPDSPITTLALFCILASGRFGWVALEQAWQWVECWFLSRRKQTEIKECQTGSTEEWLLKQLTKLRPAFLCSSPRATEATSRITTPTTERLPTCTDSHLLLPTCTNFPLVLTPTAAANHQLSLTATRLTVIPHRAANVLELE